MSRRRLCLSGLLLIMMVLSWFLIHLAGCEPAAVKMAGQDKARFTILLAQYNQMDAEEVARSFQQRAQSMLNTDAVWLEPIPSGMIVNYGYFATKADAEAAYKKIQSTYPSLNPGPLQFLYIRTMPQPDPPAPDDWNLLNRDCGYSLEIAVYFNNEDEEYFDRKKDAVRHVEQLRQSNESAYFIHGRGESHVYIGCFNINLNQLPTDNHGRPQFPPMMQMVISKYPFHYENGDQVYDIHLDNQGNKIKVPRRPILVNIRQLRQEIPF